MIRLSRKAMLALEAVLDIAVHARPDPVRSQAIARRQGVPRRYLEQVMQHLVRARILKGVRGPRGGYRLARERRRITVGEIARVVGAMESAGRRTGPRSPLGQAVVQPLWEELRASVAAKLEGLTIEELIDKAGLNDAGPGAGEKKSLAADFHI